MSSIATTELWRPVAGISKYEVSNLGRVRLAVCHRTRCGPGKIKRTRIDKDGYAITELSVDGRYLYRRLSRVVLEAFVGPPPTRSHEAAHNDGDKLNNRLSNLRWATRAENEADKVRHGTSVRGERSNLARLREDQVRDIKRRFASGASLAQIAIETGVPKQTLYNIRQGNSWRHVPCV